MSETTDSTATASPDIQEASKEAANEEEKPITAEVSNVPVPPPPKAKYRYDWYQSESNVFINILIKKLEKENVHVDYQEKSVGV